MRSSVTRVGDRVVTTMMMASLIVAGLLSHELTAQAQSSPVPFINQPLVPDAAAPGTQGFTLTVNGAGFVAGAVVRWNGSPLTTSFVNSSTLSAAVPSTALTSPGSATITALNPIETVMSDPLFFEVTRPSQVIAFGQASYPAGQNPGWVSAADVNGDGNLDLLAANAGGANVSVSLGNGDGTFRQPVTYPLQNYVGFSVIADFNGDGVSDLAVVIGNVAGQIAILLGNGDGTFQPPIYFDAGPSVANVVSGDFNGDGKLDLACALDGDLGAGSVAILIGNGDGSFQSPVDYYADSGRSDWIVTSDFNHDGYLDVAVTSFDDSAVAVLLGNGDGTFQSAMEYPTATGPADLVVADLNDDGVPDLAVATIDGGGSKTFLSILLGNGDGTFGQHVDYQTEKEALSIVAADFNGDGNVDLAVAGQAENTVLTFLGNGDGTFQQPGEFPTGTGGAPSFLAIGDFNHDGKIDLATANLDSNNLGVLLQVNAILSMTKVSFGKVRVGKSSAPIKVSLTNDGLLL